MSDSAKSSSVTTYTALGDVAKEAFIGLRILSNNQPEIIEIYIRCIYRNQFEEMRDKYDEVKTKGDDAIKDYLDVMAKLVLAAEHEKKRFISMSKTPQIEVRFPIKENFSTFINFKVAFTPRELLVVSRFFYCVARIADAYKSPTCFLNAMNQIRVSEFKSPKIQIFEAYDSATGIGYIQ